MKIFLLTVGPLSLLALLSACGANLPEHEVASNTSIANALVKDRRRIEIHVSNRSLTKDECRALIDAYRAQAGTDGQVSVHKPDRRGGMGPWCVDNKDGRGVFFNNGLWEKTTSVDETPQLAAAKDYLIKIDVQNPSGRRINVKVTTDLPDQTNLHVTVKRIYFQENKPEAYSGEFHSQDHTVKDGQIQLAVDVDDSIWFKQRQSKKKQFTELGIWEEIAKISPDVKVSVLFSPRRTQPQHILETLGTRGEFIANREPTFNSLRVEKTIPLPFKQ